MRIVGIDPSTKTGYVCLNGDGTVQDAKVIRFDDRKGFHRVQSIAKSIVAGITHHEPDLILIEHYVIGRTSACIVLMEISASIRLSLYQAGFRWMNVTPTALKKFTTGKGNAKKPDMAAHVLRRWGFESKSDDIIDAYALARIPLQIPDFTIDSNFTGITAG